MTQIEKNKADIWSDIQQLAGQPLNAHTASQLVDNMAVYDALCKVADSQENQEDASIEHPHFDHKMAGDWAAGMKNADGTHGPHFSMEKTKDMQTQYKVDCDPVLFWVVANALYSDYCEVLKKVNASTLEAYACLTKAWIHDDDAVKDKAAAYFTYVVEH